MIVRTLVAAALVVILHRSAAGETKPIAVPDAPEAATKLLMELPGAVVLHLTTSDASCAACREMEATLRTFVTYEPQIVKLDLATARGKQIASAMVPAAQLDTPSLVLVRGGRVIDRLSGVYDRDTIARWRIMWKRTTDLGRWSKSTPLDCARSILDNLEAKGLLTARDLKAAGMMRLWELADSDFDPKLAGKLTSANVRSQLVPAFLAFDIHELAPDVRKHPPLFQVGDVLVFSLGFKDEGTVLVVTRHDPANLIVDVVGYDEKKKERVDWKSYPLSAEPKEVLKRHVRAGFTWLRPLDTPLCTAKKI